MNEKTRELKPLAIAVPLNIQLDDFPLSCIYVLVDRVSGNAFLQWSNGNALSHLSITMTQLRRGIHDCRLLQNAYDSGSIHLEILRSYDNPVDDIVIRAEAYMMLSKSGYKDITGNVTPVYTTYKRVMGDYRNIFSFNPLVYVLTRSKSQESILLGIFNNMIEADTWIESFYGKSGVVNTLHYASNDATELYHSTKGYKLLRFREKL